MQKKEDYEIIQVRDLEIKTVEDYGVTRQDYEDFELHEVPGIELQNNLSGIKFILCDNMQYLRWVKDNMMRGYFHIAIVDPPYGISVGDMILGATKESKKNRNFEMGKWDGEVPTQEYWDLLKYCCRNTIAWGGNYFTKDIDFSGRCFCLWDKLSEETSFAFGELALTTYDRNPILIKRARNSKCEDEHDKRHPTQKPVYIYDRLYLEFYERGFRVLDTHGGSFNHAIAAFKNGADLTIMDRELSYYRSGIEAFKISSAKPRMQF